MEFAKGAFLGVLVGDASGATLEFMSGRRTEDEATKAMRMPGGGISNVGKGQVTDDSELAISLGLSLRKGFKIEDIAIYYHKWMKSGPFDIGITCRNAFEHETIENMKKAAMRLNLGSEANGALMRIIPLAIYGSQFDDSKLIDMVTEDAQLSHPNQVAVDCNVVYSLAISYLLQNNRDYQGCISFVEAKLQTIKIHPKVKEWFELSTSIRNVNALDHIGHVKHAFILGFYFLRSNESFVNAIKETLQCGGDTDTNAAIVGGIMGALHGASAIPDYMSMPVLNFDCTNPGMGHKRPATYKSNQYESILKTIYKI